MYRCIIVCMPVCPALRVVPESYTKSSAADLTQRRISRMPGRFEHQKHTRCPSANGVACPLHPQAPPLGPSPTLPLPHLRMQARLEARLGVRSIHAMRPIHEQIQVTKVSR